MNIKPRPIAFALLGLALLIAFWFGIFSREKNVRSQDGNHSVPATPALSNPSSANRERDRAASAVRSASGNGEADPLASRAFKPIPPAPIPPGEAVSNGTGLLPRNRIPASGPRPAALPVPTGEVIETRASMERIRRMLTDYQTLMGENPVGSNAEIMRAILGDNPKGAKLGPPDGMLLNGSGELVDPWGTPYFFHQLSATKMEIWSAGPDKKIGTGDDIILK